MALPTDLVQFGVEVDTEGLTMEELAAFEAGSPTSTVPISSTGATSTPTSTGTTTTTPIPTETIEQRQARERLDAAASGDVVLPTQDLQAVTTDVESTVTPSADVEQIPQASLVVEPAPVIAEAVIDTTAPASQADTPEEVTTAIISNIAQIDAAAPTTAAQGTISEGSIVAQIDATLSAGATAEAAQVGDIPTGATVEAVTGTMTPEEIASVAKVAGVEAARISKAKDQLRKAGLTEADIAQFANDPSALEARLSDFTEEQRGIIGGLPIEALVSTQMEQLLIGIENGETPLWAKPAVAAVEAMLTRRGLSASTIGRDALANAIIQAAFPIASQNAQSIKESVLQQRSFEQQAALTEASFKQQATLQNAQNAFNLNIRNLNAEQQAAVANSQFLQTVTLTDTNNRQQAAIQNAVNLANMDLATLDSNTRLAAQNATSFLQMDMANLSNVQQALIIDTQFEQQRLLSNTAAQNAAMQFNASSENQTNQFMASLAANIQQFNAQQLNAMSQFNATEANKIAALNSSNEIQVQEFNTQIMNQVDQFNAQQELAVEQWNAANSQAVEQSNIQWRRQANTADTAAQNAINQQNVQNAFSLTSATQANLWQELRDAIAFEFQAFENKEDREAQLYATAIGNESAAAESYDQTTHLTNLVTSFFEG